MNTIVTENKLELTLDSLKTELKSYSDKPYKCLFEYIWNSFDAKAKTVRIEFSESDEILNNVGDISIIDDGEGWDFINNGNTKTFLSSSKQDEQSAKKSLPKGKLGRGRYVFIWIAEHLEIFSSDLKLRLDKNTEVKPEKNGDTFTKGTKVCICKPNLGFSSIFTNKDKLVSEIVLEFCWFLKENPSFSIFINDEKVDISLNIKKDLLLNKDDFHNDFRSFLSDSFKVDIVLWKDKPTEWSNFYYIDEEGNEIFTESTGMNKKSDNFWHSVYVTSNLSCVVMIF